jgi:hypothetical protein
MPVQNTFSDEEERCRKKQRLGRSAKTGQQSLGIIGRNENACHSEEGGRRSVSATGLGTHLVQARPKPRGVGGFKAQFG